MLSWWNYKVGRRHTRALGNPSVLWVSTSLTTRGGIATYVRNMQATSLWQDWDIRHISTHTNGSVPTRLIAFLSGFVRFVVELSVLRPPVVHLHTSSDGSFARKCVLAWVAMGYGVPVVMHVHGSRFSEFFEGSPRPVRHLIRVTLERCAAVIALGDAWAARLVRIAPRADIVVVPNSIKPVIGFVQPTQGPVHVIFIGEVGERKGTPILLRAWARMMLEPDIPQARLTIAGDGHVDKARELVEALGIRATVDVSGWLSTAEVTHLMSTANVLVLPSLSEGQPMAILEAMARGLCVVATDVGGIAEMLGDSGGVLIRPGDETELTEALSFVVRDSEARSRIGAAALDRVVTEFNIDMIADQFDQLYRRLTGGE